MKIGILTYHRAHNFGAVLQAYALKAFLLSRNYNVSFVDYWPEYHKDVYRLFSVQYFSRQTLVGKLKYLIYFIISCHWSKLKQRKLFLNFINQFIEPKDRVDANYDIIIYGSDQIWRCQNFVNFAGYNPIYSGSADIKSRYRIAYSASMGIIYDSKELKSFLSSMLKNFDFIGVRECDLFEYIRPLLSCPLSHTIDPVFLLNKEEWLRIARPNIVKRKYILVLQWQKDADLLLTSARKVSEEMNYPLISLYGFKSSGYGPLEFLSLIYYAECVFASSFHGVAFSIIFNRPFFAYLKSNQNRVLSLLEVFGLSERFVTSVKDVCIENMIDWSVVNQKIDVWRKDSEKFLLSSIECCSEM